MKPSATQRIYRPRTKSIPQHDFLAKALMEAERAVKRAKKALDLRKKEIDSRIKAAMSNAPPDVDLWFMRNEENMSQREVAALIGRSRSLVDRYEASDPGRYYIAILHVLVQHRLSSGGEINWRNQRRRQT